MFEPKAIKKRKRIPFFYSFNFNKLNYLTILWKGKKYCFS